MTQESPCRLEALATLDPPCNARTWLTRPHPSLPIVATACADKTVRIYSLVNFQLQSTIGGGHKRSIRSVAWKGAGGGDGTALATGSFDASVGIWKKRRDTPGSDNGLEMDMGGGSDDDGDEDEDDDWTLEVILDGHDSEIKSLAFCSAAPLLATCSRDKSVWIWEELERGCADGDADGDGENFETVAVLQDHEGDVKCVAWRPDHAGDDHYPPCVASGSYDDTVRIWKEDVDDWACCALLTGHKGTVWWVEWEGSDVTARREKAENPDSYGQGRSGNSGPRLLTCSDDGTIRVWRRQPKQKTEGSGQRMPSIWKNANFDEEWFEEARLPQRHDRPVYAVSWSTRSGRVASTGSDGRILVYEEVRMVKKGGATAELKDVSPQSASTEWKVIAEIDNAHDVFEVNHIAWAARADPAAVDDEEVLVSTGDDGDVKLWTLPRISE